MAGVFSFSEGSDIPGILTRLGECAIADVLEADVSPKTLRCPEFSRRHLSADLLSTQKNSSHTHYVVREARAGAALLPKKPR